MKQSQSFYTLNNSLLFLIMIIDYVNANENAKKVMENKNGKENQASSIVGATSEDLEYVGLKKKGQKTLSLADEAKKKGGSLSMEDMMKIFG